MDWLDLRYRIQPRAVMVSPARLDMEYDELRGVIWDSCSFSGSYYSDTRTSGTLKVQDCNYIPGLFVRVYMDIPEQNYSREIGTYMVKSSNATRSNGVWTGELKLYSSLYAISEDLAPKHLTLNTGASTLDAIQQVLAGTGREYDIRGANGGMAMTPVVFEAGTSRLSRLFSLCQMGHSENRLDVDAHGRITVRPYVRPADKTPSWTIDLDDTRNIAFNDVTREANLFDLPTRAIVSYKYTTEDEEGDNVEKQIIGSAHVTSLADQRGYLYRGYEVGRYYEVDDLSSPTLEAATTLAASKLASAQSEKVLWKFSSKFFPIWEGDVVELIIRDGDPRYTGFRKCLVQNIELNAPYMDMSLTLKETNSADEE